MSSRDEILAALKDTSGALPPVAAAPLAAEDLEARFGQELVALGAELIEPSRLAELAGTTCYCDEDVPFEFQRGLTMTSDVWEAAVGMTLADLGVAESGTLMLRAGTGRKRLGSLAPPHHIALLDRANLVATLDQAFDQLDKRTSVFITGPSRTADIEGVLVRGIHGPRKLWVLLTDLS